MRQPDVAICELVITAPGGLTNTTREGMTKVRGRLGSSSDVRSGYRIYFGKDGDTIIVLLIGGDKGSQAKDITRARGFWRDYLETKRHGKAT